MLALSRRETPLHPPFAVHPPPGDAFVVTGCRYHAQAP